MSPAHTQALCSELEDLVRAAPEQWHLFQPNWPSDHEWLARRSRVRSVAPWRDLPRPAAGSHEGRERPA